MILHITNENLLYNTGTLSLLCGDLNGGGNAEKRGHISWGFPGGSDGKEPAGNAGGPGLVPELGRPLEKGMTTHSRTLVWRIPWTEVPGGLQSLGSQRVGVTHVCVLVTQSYNVCVSYSVI